MGSDLWIQPNSDKNIFLIVLHLYYIKEIYFLNCSLFPYSIVKLLCNIYIALGFISHLEKIYSLWECLQAIYT